MRSNKKGFSYVELVIVMGMLLALVTVAAGGMSVAWGARAGKAANSFGSLLSQSKVNALSGDDNYVQILYREKDVDKGYMSDGYYAELYYEGKTEPYKSESVANSRIRIEFDDGTERTELGQDHFIRISFNHSTGAVEYSFIDLTSNIDSDSLPTTAPDETKIYFVFGNQHCLTLYRLTGEHSMA